MGIAVRHVGRATLLGAGALATTLAAEVVAAKRRRFLPSDPVLEIGGVVGPEDGEPLVLVVLGDSSVAGVGADSAQDTLTYGVAKALTDRYRVELHALGVSGSKLCNVVGEQLAQVAGLDPDVVLVCVGTNDVTHGTTFREARRQLRLARRLRGEGTAFDLGAASVGRHDHSGGGDLRSGELQARGQRAAVKQTLSPTEHEREDPQAELVDKPGLEQRLNQIRAAVHLKLGPSCCLSARTPSGISPSISSEFSHSSSFRVVEATCLVAPLTTT